MPPKLQETIARALEKKADVRYQSAADLRAELRRLKRDLDSNKSHPAITSSIPEVQVHRRSRWPYAAVGAVVAVIAVSWLTRPPPPPRVTGTLQITSDGRPKTPPLLSDGSRLFFNSGATSNEPYQVSVNGGESVALPMQLKNAYLLDISPDRTELLICRYLGSPTPTSTCELWAAPLLGGSPRRLGNLFSHLRGAAWSPDGQQIVYARDRELHLARSDGTEIRKLATVGIFLNFVRWSPDGDRVRFSVSEYVTASSLWEASIDGGQLHPVLPGWNPSSFTCCSNWTQDGKCFVFQASKKGISTIWALREKAGYFQPANREPVQLTTGPLAASFPVPSPDGRRLFIEGLLDRREFLRYDLKSGQTASQLGGISGTYLEFSRDGNWVTYISVPEGSLWRGAPDGSQRLQLTSPPMRAFMPHWSPDGKQIAFFGERTGKPARIFVGPFDGGPLHQVTNGESGKYGDWDPSWSPDGTSLAFGSTVEATASEASIHMLDPKTQRVTTLPGSEGDVVSPLVFRRTFYRGSFGVAIEGHAL